MLIDCPGCARSYHVGQTDLGERGRTVVCPRCSTQWYQAASGRDISIAAVSARPPSRLDEAPARPRRLHFARNTLAIVATSLCCLALTSLVVGRNVVVRALPRTAALYAAVKLPVNVDGLAFVRVAPERLASNDVTVRGALRNVAGRKIRVPRLAFEVRDDAGSTLVAWSETISAKTLAAGGELAFASAPHRLPAEGRSVLVHLD